MTSFFQWNCVPRCHSSNHSSPSSDPVPIFSIFLYFDFDMDSLTTDNDDTSTDCISSITTKSAGIERAASNLSQAESIRRFESFVNFCQVILCFPETVNDLSNSDCSIAFVCSLVTEKSLTCS